MISIVMAVWNRKELTEITIKSVLAQTYKDFEFIIVDDGSTDGVVEMIEEYVKKDKRIKLIKTKHSGCTDTTNVGFKEMKGDVVCVLGSDDLWTPNKLERQVEFAKDYPDYILHTNSINIDEEGNEIYKVFFNDATPIEYKQIALSKAGPWFATSSWYIPRNIFDKVGEFEGIYNDYQWIMRAILLHDAKMKLIPEFLTSHRTTKESNTFKFIGQTKFKELAKEIQTKIMEEMGEEKILNIIKDSVLICSRCKREIPKICPECGADLRKKENIICRFGMDYTDTTPNHCVKCWEKIK